MKTSVRNKSYQTTVSSIYFTDDDGTEYELNASCTPVAEHLDQVMARAGDKVIFGYLVQDDPAQSPADWDGEGKIVLMSDRYSSRSEQEEALAALGLDVDGNPDIDDIAYESLEGWIAADRERHLWCAKEMRRRYVAWHGSDGVEPDDEELLGEYSVHECVNDLSAEFRDGNWTGAQPLYREWYQWAIEEWGRRLQAGKIGVKYAMVCDVYEHGGIHVSLSNTRGYPDEQWDVARGGAVWIPDQCAIDNIDWPEYVERDTPEEHAKRARDYVKGCIETWNMYWSGDVWGHVVEVHEFNEEGMYDGKTIVEEDSCWGHYGDDYAEEEMKSVVESFVKAHQEMAEEAK